MAFDGVPWAVENGADMHAAVARAAHYAATRGAQGIALPGDLKVTATPTASKSLNIASGSVTIPNAQAPGESYQGLARTQTGIDINVNGSARNDMVIARIVDPDFSPWQPTDVPDNVNGPYFQPFVLQGVGSAVEASQIVGYSAYALARVAVPASGNITNSMITDLRGLAQPRSDNYLTSNGGAAGTVGGILTSQTYVTWPVWTPSFVIPEWCTQINTLTLLSGIQVPGGVATDGDLVASVELTNGTAIQVSGQHGFDFDPPANGERANFVLTCGGFVPAQFRGETARVRIKGRIYAHTPTGSLDAQLINAAMAVDVRFYERTV